MRSRERRMRTLRRRHCGRSGRAVWIAPWRLSIGESSCRRLLLVTKGLYRSAEHLCRRNLGRISAGCFEELMVLFILTLFIGAVVIDVSFKGDADEEGASGDLVQLRQRSEDQILHLKKRRRGRGRSCVGIRGCRSRSSSCCRGFRLTSNT